jgi:DNA-binding transcriptional LysR family regulator
VADCGTFTAAAERVSRTQSAVSLQVKRLEESLGRKVLERTSRSLALTPAGATLLEYARRMLELNDESVRRLTQPPVRGAFRLGITEYFLPGELPVLLARFGAAYPEVQLDVRMGLSSELRDALRADALDSALVRLAPAESHKALWKEPQRWVAADTFEDRRDAPLPLVLLPEPCVLRRHAIESLKRAKRPWRMAFCGSSMTSVQAAVRAGIGVSIMPRSCIGPGMRALSGAPHRDPGMLHIGLVRASAAPRDIVDAVEEAVKQVAVG